MSSFCQQQHVAKSVVKGRMEENGGNPPKISNVRIFPIVVHIHRQHGIEHMVHKNVVPMHTMPVTTISILLLYPACELLVLVSQILMARSHVHLKALYCPQLRKV